jgi:hypothetical protein
MPLRDSCGLTQRRIASTMSSSGSTRLRRSSRISTASQSLIAVARRCRRVERSATSWRARQRAPQCGDGRRARGPVPHWRPCSSGYRRGCAGGGGVGMQPLLHQRALPEVDGRQRRDRRAETLAPVGPPGRTSCAPPDSWRSRGSLLWTTGTELRRRRHQPLLQKAHSLPQRAPSRQSSETKHGRPGSLIVAREWGEWVGALPELRARFRGLSIQL